MTVNLERARNAVLNDLAALESICADWAYEDDTYK
jgi:sensor domain CHASE-containing protein